MDKRTLLRRSNGAAQLNSHAHNVRLNKWLLMPRQWPQRRRCRCLVAAAQSDGDRQKLEDFKVTCFSSQRFVRDFMGDLLQNNFPNSNFVEARLDVDTAALAQGSSAVILFVNDDCSAEVGKVLYENGVRFVAMRCAGFDQVDIKALNELGMKVARVPTYSPESVAEHSVTLAMCLNRNVVRAHQRIAQGNYTLSGLIGFEICKKTIGIVGTGAIGACAARIWKGFGTRVLAYDITPNPALEEVVEYVDLDTVLAQSDVLSLHCPLLPSTFHLISEEGIKKMKPGAMLVNVSRGGLVDTTALIDALEDGSLGGVAMDVYELESKLFFQDFSVYTAKDYMATKTWDRNFQLLLSLPNVIVTPHVAFLTSTALEEIAATTVENLTEFALGQDLTNEVLPPQ